MLIQGITVMVLLTLLFHETIPLNDTASLAIRLAEGQNNLKILYDMKSKRHLNSCLSVTAGRVNTWWSTGAFIIIIFYGTGNYFV